MLDLLLPQRCVACGAAGRQLCDACRESLPRIAPPLCARCGAPTAWPVERCRECAGRRLAFASARAAVEYDGPVRRLVASWKERGLRRLADDAAALLPDACGDAVAFVPPDRSRRLTRGYHPAERLALAAAERWSLACEPLLSRSGTSQRQRGLSLTERRRNVAGAFRCASAPERVVLVDDVYTTGATAHAAAAALRAGGARRVDVVTFARALRSA
jgi:ComF family protein